ncbi:MAG: tryptophan--tRNA ligase [Deltaproteobacteria bacterium RIFOXYA12_FULL_61_11]|nr:MAG: tryptophan--tRNA ligase [Deltaproteobacteria bacterium RIFOXYA12_FULL_61_11]
MITAQQLLSSPRMFSGVQPTGDLHLGNYLGAIASWIKLLDQHPGIFAIVDYHAITVPFQARDLASLRREAALTYLACGLDPERCLIFEQSRVPEHTELAWIFSTLCPMGLLERMTQFKDKKQQHAASINLGLFAYPVLQAADILLYNAELVPVGEDQAQHLELTRELARKFNTAFGQLFVEPQTYLSKTPRLLGIYGKEKMSKSKGNHIPLLSDEKTLRKTINRCTTDTKRITATDPGVPADCPMFSNLHTSFTPEAERAQILAGCTTATLGCGACKAILFEHLNTVLTPIRERRAALAEKPRILTDILEHGAVTARAIATETLQKAKSLMGLQ